VAFTLIELLVASLFVGPLIGERLDEFDRLSADQRPARLDASIDQFQRSRADNSARVSSAERMSLMLEYVDRETQARVRKHIPALLVCIKERGVRSGLPF